MRGEGDVDAQRERGQRQRAGGDNRFAQSHLSRDQELGLLHDPSALVDDAVHPAPEAGDVVGAMDEEQDASSPK